MSRPDSQLNMPAVADADLSANQYRAVVPTANNGGNGVALAGANVVILGILQDKPNANGKACAVCVEGPTRAAAGAAFARGAELKTDATGRLIAAGAELPGVIVNVVAIAFEAAAAAGDIKEVVLRHYTINRAVS